MSQARRSSRRKKVVNEPSQSGSAKNIVLDSSSGGSTSPTDYLKLSAGEIRNAILERNKDPVIEALVLALIAKIPQEISGSVESEKRARSIVVYGLLEAVGEQSPSSRQQDLESKVSCLLDTLDVECRPLEVFRMGKLENEKPRLVKIVLPSKSHWKKALSNSYKLRGSQFSGVYVRRSMTLTERIHEKELREECRERNRQMKVRAWVVYRGELRRVQDLPQARLSGNA